MRRKGKNQITRTSHQPPKRELSMSLRCVLDISRFFYLFSYQVSMNVIRSVRIFSGILLRSGVIDTNQVLCYRNVE